MSEQTPTDADRAGAAICGLPIETYIAYKQKAPDVAALDPGPEDAEKRANGS
jgi:hypothetical protein